MKTSLLTLSALFVLVLNAAAQIDLGITAISKPQSNETIHTVSPTLIKATVTNYSDEVFPAGSVDLVVLVDGTERSRETISIDKDIPAGGTKVVSSFPTIDGILPGDAVICISVEHGEDADPSNNTSTECVDVTVSTIDNLNFKIESTVIVTPAAINPGSEVKGGQRIKEFSFSLWNWSGLTVPVNTQIPVVVTVDGVESETIVLTVDKELEFNTFTILTYNHKESEVEIPGFPEDAGKAFDVCFTLNYPYDKKHVENNEECFDLKVLDNSSSIGETLPSFNFESNANGLSINLSSLGNTEVLSYEIIGLSGRIVSSGSANGQSVLQISNDEIPYNEPFIVRLNTPDKAIVEKLFISK